MSQAIRDQEIHGVPFGRFLNSPTPKRFLELQRLIFAMEGYEGWSHELRRLGQLFDTGRFESLLMISDQLYVNWLLSPMFHYLVGNAALELGEQEQADYEKVASRACLTQLMNSGDGSSDAPYRVTYLSDERDIVLALDFDVRCQKLVETDRGPADVFTMHDGQEIWFDVEPILYRMNARSRQVAP